MKITINYKASLLNIINKYPTASMTVNCGLHTVDRGQWTVDCQNKFSNIIRAPSNIHITHEATISV